MQNQKPELDLGNGNPKILEEIGKEIVKHLDHNSQLSFAGTCKKNSLFFKEHSSIYNKYLMKERFKYPELFALLFKLLILSLEYLILHIFTKKIDPSKN